LTNRTSMAASSTRNRVAAALGASLMADRSMIAQ
jgi:hypothetical protein